MLFHHLYYSIPSGVEPYTGLLYWLGNLGKICVSLFLFCSGYGMAAQYKNITGFSNSCKFVIKRLISFYLNYWFIFLIFVPITILLFGRPFSAAYGDNLTDMESVMFLFQDILGLAGSHSYNITWWFNFMIIIFYLIFPFVSWISRKSGIFTILLSITVFGFLKLDYSINLYQLTFVSGIIWHNFQDNNQIILITKKVNDKYLLIGALIYTCCVIALRMYPIIPKWNGVKIDTFLTIGIVLLIILFLRKSKIQMSLYSFLGKHATNIYLTHTFVNAYWNFHWLHESSFMRSGVNFIVLLIISLSISLLLEYIKKQIGLYKLLNLLKMKLS